jgi:serine protease AprX
MKIRLITFLLFLCAFTQLSAQKINKYWIELRDKNHSPYCTCRPAEFLSLRALERRAKAGIEVVENDLPVSPFYLDRLRETGVKIHGVSRWLNAVSVMADSNTIKQVYQLDFVRSVQYIGPHLKFRNPPNRPTKSRTPTLTYPKPGGKQNPLGYATMQNSLFNLTPLYAAGFRGAGIWVAVMDGGYTNADTIALFDSLALNGRLIPGWDFVERDAGLFESAQHGTSVLSVMAANLPGYFVGTAPDATYFLLKTEDTGGEFPIEEANWISGAEWADSVGVDIINASLGYTQFNDTTLGHRYWELDGKTTIGSRGASIAATKGMIICNSAGNEGDNAWRHIGSPADAPGIIAVGAVDDQGLRAAFSSFGPTADGRIKPDLMAPGDQVVVAGNVGIDLGISSGTSLASPMLVGALAALWSAAPDKTSAEVLEAVFKAADQIESPDNERGYGLPNFTAAWLELQGYHTEGLPFAYHRAVGELLVLLPDLQPGRNDRFELLDRHGKPVKGAQAKLHLNMISKLTISNLQHIEPGFYFIKHSTEQTTRHYFCVVWP